MTLRTIARRLAITGIITGLGGVGGALAAVGLTLLGNVLIDLVRSSGGNVHYQWSVGAFALTGALASPLLAWSTLRSVPLWRLVAEPAAAAVLGTAAGVAFAPVLTPILAPAAAIGAILRLRRTHDQGKEVGSLVNAASTGPLLGRLRE